MGRARLALVCVVIAGFAASASPDLVIEEIATTPRGVFHGDSVRITATVRNQGDTAVSAPFYVAFLVDGRRIGAPTVPGGIPSGGYADVSTLWTADVGNHTIAAVADDPLNRIPEASEINNRESTTIVVAADPETGERLAEIKVAVSPFADLSASGFVNLGTGVASEIAERLVESGVRVIGWEELEHTLRDLELDPSSVIDLATGARQLTADLLVLGEVTALRVERSTFGLGVAVNLAAADIEMTARLLDVSNMEYVGEVGASAREEGITGFSVDLSSLFGFLQPLVGIEMCSGGLTVGRGAYDLGETVHIGYRNDAPSGWFDLEIATGRETFVRWLGSRFVKAGGCGEWLWDQKDGSDVPMAPGLYVARLWEGGAVIAETGFWVEPTEEPGAPPIEEVTVGSGSFAETIVGRATDSAANQLASALVSHLASLPPRPNEAEGVGAYPAAGQVVVQGQIAQLFLDGRVAINIGASHGLSKWDVLEVLEVSNVVTDPSGEQLLSYEILGTKGELIVVEVSDLGAVAMKASSFDAEVGDVVRLVEF